ncbi:hypothetical protein KR054_007784, partial [Drosophila jambulina]
TPVKWYLLYMTGSLNRTNKYVRRYTEDLERRDLVPMPCSRANRQKILPMEPVISVPEPVKTKIKRRRTRRKLPKTKAVETDPVNPCYSGTRIDSLSIPDSPEMLKFFAEVRQRQHRDYYLRMKAAERCSRVPVPVPAICPNWEPSSQKNIYCSGAKTVRQKLHSLTKNSKGCDGYGDSTRLWRS